MLKMFIHMYGEVSTTCTLSSLLLISIYTHCHGCCCGAALHVFDISTSFQHQALAKKTRTSSSQSFLAVKALLRSAVDTPHHLAWPKHVKVRFLVFTRTKLLPIALSLIYRCAIFSLLRAMSQ